MNLSWHLVIFIIQGVSSFHFGITFPVLGSHKFLHYGNTKHNFVGYSVKSSRRLMVNGNTFKDHHFDSSKEFPDQVTRSLDLAPLLREVSKYSGTRRGQQALLSTVNEDMRSRSKMVIGGNRNRNISSKRAWAEGFHDSKLNDKRKKDTTIVSIATTAQQAREQYELVEAATLALTVSNQFNLTFPPIYGIGMSPFDIDSQPKTDDDEWLILPADSWTLEYLLQAEKVIELLLKTKEWSTREETQTWMTGLGKIGSRIDEEDQLASVLEEVANKVEIISIKTATRGSYMFKLRTDSYPVLRLLREKESRARKAGAKDFDTQIVSLLKEIEEVEGQIRHGLAQLILSVSEVIDDGLDHVARLDSFFSRAAFGMEVNGVFPRITKNGEIKVEGFVHPVLTVSNGLSSSAKPGESGHITPIDLCLNNETGKRVLLISGPNGGGKTLSMKSFGLVCVLSKLGIPIPTMNQEQRPTIGFFNDVLINVGDKQDVLEGTSTWTSSLNACSGFIEHLKSNPDKNHLVLFDELGSGTDPEAGGAIAQAVLEELMKNDLVCIVATTHSPRLKTLSFENDRYSCASVLLESGTDDEYRQPTFRLEYGIIGESHALGAASRCKPALPESVFSRATALMSEDTEGGISRGRYMQALTLSIEKQLDQIEREKREAEALTRDNRNCRRAMVLLASSYETHLERLEDRLDDCYQRLVERSGDVDYKVIGETLSELKITKKKILSQKEHLKEKGLKMMPSNYQISVGESLVMVGSEDHFDGTIVQVVADASSDKTLTETEILVRGPSSTSSEAWDDLMDASFNGISQDLDAGQFVVQRHDMAIWDYDSIWEDDENQDQFSYSTSVGNSKQRLSSLLSTLKPERSSGGSTVSKSASPKDKKSFTSARARKANRKKK